MILLRKKGVAMEEGWSDPMTYAAVLTEVSAFIPGRGRYRREGERWTRWQGEKRLMPRIDAQLHDLPVLRPILEVQRESDRAWIEIQKVAN
jgi:hypothetical protein